MAESSSRRDFLTGRAAQAELEQHLADAAPPADRPPRPTPQGGDTVRLGTRAMACDFDVILNPGPSPPLVAASAALDLVDQLEDQLSVYREHSELSQLNRRAANAAVAVEPQLFQLLLRARALSEATGRGFDPTAGPLIALWRAAQAANHVPTQAEIDSVLERIGIGHVAFDEDASTVLFTRQGVELNLGSIGKGYALDRAAECLAAEGIEDWLLHGGHSSLLARGEHQGQGGWPIGIRDPLFPDRRLATLLLSGLGMSTSGSGVQFFRHEGRRYGHILDPRTGWPVEGMLSVTVLAPTAAEADALSTAFFVLGLDATRAYCEQHSDVAALVIPAPAQGRRLEPINCGISEEWLFWETSG